MVRFSERIGIVPPKPLQVDSLDEETRILLWNVIEAYFYNQEEPYKERLILTIRSDFMKKIGSTRVGGYGGIVEIREWFFIQEWYEVYDLIEFIYSQISNDEFSVRINSVLKKKRCGYRFISDLIAPIFNDIDISVFEGVSALSDDFAEARRHVKAAVSSHSNRQGPDYRRAVREAILAVEAAAKVVCGNDGANLRKALTAVAGSVGLHPAFGAAFDSLYAWTSDEKGVRHALLDDVAAIDEATSYFMIVACSAFVGYLAQKTGVGPRVDAEGI